MTSDNLSRAETAWMKSLCCAVLFVALLLSGAGAVAAQTGVARFFGTYQGTAVITQLDGEEEKRDMSVDIRQEDYGFRVDWTTAIATGDREAKQKSYSIAFRPSARDGVYAAAMATNVFGHTVQMDPMKGEPFVWSRILGDTLTIFSLYVAPNGDYMMQQYDRTLVEGGLALKFLLHRNGQPTRSVDTFLAKVSD